VVCELTTDTPVDALAIGHDSPCNPSALRRHLQREVNVICWGGWWVVGAWRRSAVGCWLLVGPWEWGGGVSGVNLTSYYIIIHPPPDFLPTPG